MRYQQGWSSISSVKSYGSEDDHMVWGVLGQLWWMYRRVWVEGVICLLAAILILLLQVTNKIFAFKFEVISTSYNEIVAWN